MLVTRVKQDTNKTIHALTVHISLSGRCVDFSIGVDVRGQKWIVRNIYQVLDWPQPMMMMFAND